MLYVLQSPNESTTPTSSASAARQATGTLSPLEVPLRNPRRRPKLVSEDCPASVFPDLDALGYKLQTLRTLR